MAVLSVMFYDYDNCLRLDYLQHCFRFGSPSILTREFFRPYGGCRRRLLELAVEQAFEFNFETIEKSGSFQNNSQNNRDLDLIINSRSKFKGLTVVSAWRL
ncbi:hypothetical protein J4479_03145 [Candidatus Woesearchaeota archaeon]|nr:hypothetical protein [Candidatus Woesearchaeota archaeon]